MVDERPDRNNGRQGYSYDLHHRLSMLETEIWRLKQRLEAVKKEGEDDEPILRFALKKWQLYVFASFLFFLATSRSDPEKVITLLHTLAQALAAK